MTQLLIFLMLLGLGYGFGSWAERSHYQRIRQREYALRNIQVLTLKEPRLEDETPRSQMVMGNAVISVDYFKQFIAKIVALLGGRISTYESLLDRARREAILRMQAQADALGAVAVFNLKIETSSISKGFDGSVGSVEVLAYGTALIP